MLRMSLTGLFLLAGASALAGDQPPVTKYDRIISAKYPDFRVMTAADYEAWLRPSFEEGRRGGLIVGNFDLDKRQDFAAFLIGLEVKRYEGTHPYDYHHGRLVTCHGLADGEAYECAEDMDQRRTITLPYDTVLERIPPGTHVCTAEDPDRTVVTIVDGVGQVSEKSSGFSFVRADETEDYCLTGD